jgi:hypothetical protein
MPADAQLPSDSELIRTDRRAAFAHDELESVDFADLTPMRGVSLGAGEHELRVAVDVCEVR